MFTFDEFVEEVRNNILNYLPGDMSAESVAINEDFSRGFKRTNLLIKNEDINLNPEIYLEKYYDTYSNQELDFDSAMKKIAEEYVNNMPKENVDVEDTLGFEKVKKNIIPCFVNQSNDRYLDAADNIVKRNYCEGSDISIIYRIVLNTDEKLKLNIGATENDNVTAIVTNKLLKAWNVTADELHKIAVENISAKTTVKGIFETINEMLGGGIDVLPIESTEMDDMMLVISNEDRFHGATSILDQTLMDSIKNKLGEDIYVIPCSVHELILFKNEPGIDIESLLGLISYINETELRPEEKLSDNLFTYDFERHEMLLAKNKVRNREVEKTESNMDQSYINMQPRRVHGR